MPLDPDYICNRDFGVIESAITDHDVMLYALSIGLGSDPVDARELRYVYEKDLQVFPTMPLVIGHPGNWMVEAGTGITRSMVVHGAQRLETLRQLPIGGTVVTRNRVTDIWDKGDKGAIIEIERTTTDKASGDLVAVGSSSVFCRADGGFGGASGPAHEFLAVPDRAPDHAIDIPTRPDMALLYRLNQDRNPLHADPTYAARARFPKPILHGLATFGVAAVAIDRAFPDAKLKTIEARFSKPVYPGETIGVELWDEGGMVRFRACVADRVVLDRGRAELG